LSRSDTYLEVVSVAHMTPEHADAVKEIARLTHAVPAEEATKQTRSILRWESARFVVALAGLIAVMAAGKAIKVSDGTMIWILIVYGAIAVPSLLAQEIGRIIAKLRRPGA